MVLKRRGVFFSLSALFFVGVLLFVFTTDYGPPPMYSTGTVVATTDAYRERLEDSYMPMLLRERSYATLRALSIDADLDDRLLVLPGDFEEAIMTRSYRGNPLTMMTLPEALGNLSNVSRNASVNVTISVNDITVRQVGAFQALYEANYSYNLSSADGSVRFSRDIETFGTFFLNGIPDRYYNELNPWGEKLSVQQYRPETWNASEFANMSLLRRYSTHNESPSLFGRLTGDLGPSPYGIQVTVPSTVAFAAGDNRTVFDWEYFADTRYSCTYTHPQAYANLRLSFNQTVNYNLTGSSLAYGNPVTCPPAP